MDLTVMRVIDLKIVESRIIEPADSKPFKVYKMLVENDDHEKITIQLFTNEGIPFFKELDEIIVDLEANQGCCLEDSQCCIEENVERLKALVPLE